MLKLRAIVIALAAFTIFHILLLVAARMVVGMPERVVTVATLLNVLAYVLYLATGFLAGLVARTAGVAHGVVSGFFAAAIAISFFQSEQRELLAAAVVALNGMILGGIGGAVSLLFARESKEFR